MGFTLSRWRAKRADAKKRKAAALKNVTKAANDLAFANRVLKRHSTTPAAKALAFAKANIGVVEHPANSNRGPKIDQWQRDVDMLGQPWCGAFVHAALKAAGVKGLSSRMRYTPYILSDAKNGANGLTKVVSWADAKPGDVVLFNWDGGVVDHVGLVEKVLSPTALQTIEGNTSSSTAGSQSNGGGVYRRTRDRHFVAAIIRPTWP